MNKQNATVLTKKLIDIILGLLFILLLGYSFAGGQFHELAGIVFMVVTIIHNIINVKWYKTLKKGIYNKKRKLVTAINIALILDIGAILLTGLINSRYLIQTSIQIAGIGQIHSILALIGFVLIVYHILVHVFNHTKKKYRKLPIILMVTVLIFSVLMGIWVLPYLKRHFKTVEIDRENVVSGESIDSDGRTVLIAYFTRVGNTDFVDDVDAVSGASLLLDEEEKLLGNSQVIAQMVQDATGGDIISINTEKKYPSSYFDTVSAASAEMKSQELPELIDMPENIDSYDTVFLIYPLWWYTIPKAVESFLNSYDFSDKMVIPIVTHGGSGAGRSVEDLKSACNGIVVENPLEIYCDDVQYCRERVTDWLRELYAVHSFTER